MKALASLNPWVVAAVSIAAGAILFVLGWMIDDRLLFVSLRNGSTIELAELAAQQEMADWTFWMALLGGVGLLVSCVGIALIYSTFRATQGQLEVAREAHEVSKRLLTARLTRVEARFEELPLDKFFMFTYRVKNTGPTAATALSGHAKVGMRIGDGPVHRTVDFVADSDMRDIGAEADASLLFVNRSFHLAPAEVSALNSNSLFVEVELLLRYADIFGTAVDAGETFAWLLRRFPNGHILADLRPKD